MKAMSSAGRDAVLAVLIAALITAVSTAAFFLEFKFDVSSWSWKLSRSMAWLSAPGMLPAFMMGGPHGAIDTSTLLILAIPLNLLLYWLLSFLAVRLMRLANK